MTIGIDDLNACRSALASLRTQVAKAERVKAILHGVTLDAPLAGDDLKVVLGLLAAHPNVIDKVGAGISHITVIRNMGSRSFQLHRIDGTFTDFSYRKCLSPVTPKQAVSDACRAAIRPAVQTIKMERLWSSGLCELTGLPITDEDSQVHHAPPMFDQLVGTWILTRGGFETVADRLVRGDNIIGQHLSHDDQADWLAYHNQHAVLMLVHKKANLSIEAARRTIKAG